VVTTGLAIASRWRHDDAARAAASHGRTATGLAKPTAAELRRAHAAQHAAIARLIRDGHPVFCGGGRKPLVALTFDDGPGPYTPHTLRVLRQHGAKGTFFLVARVVTGWPSLKDVPRQEAAQGAVGDHTFNHQSLPGMTADELQHEIGDARTVVQAASGRTVRLFRPPYGAHDAAIDALVRSLRMLDVLWSVDSGDSQGATADQIVATLRDDVRPGSIVLLHENRGTTRKALPAILDLLRDRGLRAVTVPELLAADPPSPAQLRTESCD
jgi:peptidoglycan/xylan/chitin deacetylase (PgdA/CDA1 family)